NTNINSNDGKTKENPEVAQTKIVEATLVSQETKDNLGTLLASAEATNPDTTKNQTIKNTIIKEKTDTLLQQATDTQENSKSNTTVTEKINTVINNKPQEIVVKENTSRSIPVPIISILVISAIAIMGWMFWKTISEPAIIPTPEIVSNTPLIKQEKVEVLEYWLEILPKNKTDNSSVKKADVKAISSQDDIKFHFLAKKSGYLYILGLGEGNNLTTFLTNNPSPATGLTSNKIEEGEKLVFPNGATDSGDNRVISFNNQHGQENYTIIFSAQPLAAPSFLNSKPGYLLVAGKIDEWEQFQQIAEKVTISISQGNEKVESIAKVLSSNKNLDKPIIFNITFEHN
ncbi:MAG: DUF4384 domain-containing protein, partial [Blastocatellia bacterium]